MTDDDRMDEIIRGAAADYNRPPATPRDEMWAAIQAAGQAQPVQRLQVVGGSASRRPQPGHRSIAARYTWIGAAAAAVLLVATGVGIGRWTRPAPANAPVVASAPPSATPAITGVMVVPGEAESPNATATRAPDEIRRNPVVTGTGEVRLLASASPRASRPAAVSNGNGMLQTVSYQVATQQHLQDAEALLTSFSLESRDERMNVQFAGWAKGLLSNTRLLLDSPAGDDPRRARLLQDLELVLAQIVQLSPDAAATDRELIQGSIQNGLVMTRLRSAIPADQPREITER